MQRGRRIALILIVEALLLGFLAAADMLLLVAVSKPFSQKDAGVSYYAEELSVTEQGVAMSEEGLARLDESGNFAMVLSEDGEVVWSYNLPEELDRKYTLSDVARFARYYLDDYPVHTWVCDAGLIVVGGQRDTVWKYGLEFSINELERLARVMPWMAAANIALLVIVPVYLVRRQLRRRERERTEWIAGVSHDIRTPLSLIIGEADALRDENAAAGRDEAGDGADGQGKIASRADSIVKQGLRIRALVADMNTASKLDYGMGDYPLTLQPIGATLRTILAEIIDGGGLDGLDLEPVLPEELGRREVRVNVELLRRLLENLLRNACESNPDGVRVRVELCEGRAASSGADFDKQSGDRSKRASLFAATRLYLIISDDGCGVSDEMLRRMNRSHRGDSRLGEHGIGLRLVKQIARYHRWRVRFYHNVPSGLRCEIRI